MMPVSETTPMQAKPCRTLGSELSAEKAWAAVCARDASFDGQFYYSVATTGVYCRPSCASRRARRENVAFHASCAAAKRAGFRACRRCKPDEPPLQDRYAGKVADACRAIEQSEVPPTLAALARGAGLSPHHFHRVFKAIAGVTPKEYADACRQSRVRQALGTGKTSITKAFHEAGYNASSRFYANARQILGMKPSDFSRGGAKSELRFAVGQCSLGAIIVAASDKGIAAVLLGDDPGDLVRDLQDRFPKATLTGGNRTFERMVAKVVGLVDAPAAGLDLPLDIRGTAFQHRVWQALRAIPPGETATYRDIANRIGMPKAIRAVAAACAANKLAVAIPCHRVVRSDGTLSGYRWGVARKRALLDREMK